MISNNKTFLFFKYLKLFTRRLHSFSSSRNKSSSFKLYNKSLPFSIFPIAYCAGNDDCSPQIKFKKESLTNECLIKQSCTLAIDACTQLLTHTTNAILQNSHRYRKNAEKLIGLIEMLIEYNGQNCDELNMEIIKKRSCVEEDMTQVLELESFFDYVQKISTDAAEVAYLAGVDFMSTSMCERINCAVKQLELEKTSRKDVEFRLRKVNEKLVKCSQQQ